MKQEFFENKITKNIEIDEQEPTQFIRLTGIKSNK